MHRKDMMLAVHRDIRLALEPFLMTPAHSRVTVLAHGIVADVLMKHYREGTYPYDPMEEPAIVRYSPDMTTIQVDLSNRAKRYYSEDVNE